MARATFFRLGKAFASYRRPLWLLAQRLARRPLVEVQDHATGLRFRCLRGADLMLGDVFHTCLYDVPLAPVRAVDFVIDIGANHGFAALYFARRGADVLAFEPSAAVAALLRHNLETNQLGERVSVVEAAVSDRDGTAELRETDALGGGMSTLESTFAATSGATYAKTSRIAVRGINGVLASTAPRAVRLLKIDCEGSELAILRAIPAAERARIESIALEYHANAYPLARLAEVLEDWRDFHVSKAASPGIGNAVLHLVRRDVARSSLTA